MRFKCQQFSLYQGLFINVEGEAFTQMLIFARRIGPNKYEKPSSASRTYSIYSSELLNSNGEIIEIGAGTHSYSLECRLPTDIPYSIQGKAGEISYVVKAVLVCIKGGGLEAKKSFRVVCCEDLSLYPELLLPVEEEKFFANDTVIITLRLPRSCFGIDEKIPLSISIVNLGQTKVKEISFTFTRIDLFKTYSPRVYIKEVSKSIVKSSLKSVAARGSAAFEELIDLPKCEMIPSNRNCDIFRIFYRIEVNAKIDSTKAVVKFPVVIGTKGSMNFEYDAGSLEPNVTGSG